MTGSNLEARPADAFHVEQTDQGLKQALRARFVLADIEWVPSWISVDGKRAVLRARPKPEAVTARLDACLPGACDFRVRMVPGYYRAAVLGTLTCCGGLRFEAVGQASPDDSFLFSAATADALIRCASLLGVGAYLQPVPGMEVAWDAALGGPSHWPALPEWARLEDETISMGDLLTLLSDLRGAVQRAPASRYAALVAGLADIVASLDADALVSVPRGTPPAPVSQGIGKAAASHLHVSLSQAGVPNSLHKEFSHLVATGVVSCRDSLATLDAQGRARVELALERLEVARVLGEKHDLLLFAQRQHLGRADG